MNIRIVTYPTISKKMVKDICKADVVKIKFFYKDVVERLTGTEHKEAYESIWVQVEEIDEKERMIIGTIDNYSYFLTSDTRIEPFKKGEYLRFPFEGVVECKNYEHGVLTQKQIDELKRLNLSQQPQTEEDLRYMFTKVSM